MTPDPTATMPRAADLPLDRRAQFEALLSQHRGIVLKVAATYARDAEDRADLAQEIAAQLWHAWPRYDSTRAFSTWMYRIALNVAISFVRGNARRLRHAVAMDPELHDLADPDAGDPEAERQLHALYRFIRQQKPLDRALLVLYLDDRSHADIADILGLGPSNVGTRIGRLKQRLRTEL